ncbi:MAG: hypothetical protein J5804_01095 [Eggerthellaceae bacterium]|nr:hypothetical protein [Eggerthellaceae bacterium]
MANETSNALAAIANHIGCSKGTAERDEQLASLAQRILEESRIRLMMAFRFLDRALWKMPIDLGSCTSWPLATNGSALLVDPPVLIDLFRNNPDRIVRAYLHTLLHCIFRHPLHTVRANPDAWELACDICVEAIAVELCPQRFALKGDHDILQVISALEQEGVSPTPACVYRSLLLWQTQPPSEPRLANLASDLTSARTTFARDSHELWDLVQPCELREHDNVEDGTERPQAERKDQDKDNAPNQPDASSPQEGNDDAKGNDGSHQTDSEEDPENETVTTAESEWDDTQKSQVIEATYEENNPAGTETSFDTSSSDMEQEWATIAKQVEAGLREFEQQYGTHAGCLSDNLTLANRCHTDFADFLRRFAARSEVMQVNEEEFDYLFYTYGLKQYGNVAIVEPLEYQEDRNVSEFVIAIDTSGSCSSGLTRAFVTRTYEILSQACAHSGRMNVHIIECDAQVQSDTIITDMGDLRAYERAFEVRGFGGTDFRPAFDYVSHLANEGAFEDLRGLIYFTDGFGAFPEQAPGYDVAFVFVERAGKKRRVPAWACKVIMDEDDLEMLEGDR